MIADPMELTGTRGRRNKTVSIQLEGLPAIHSPEAEKALLGAIISSPDPVLDVAIEKGLSSEDFFNPAHALLFDAVKEMRNNNTAIDAATLLQYLDDRKLTEASNGAALIGELAAGVVSVLTAPVHIETVLQKSKLRRLQDACAKIVFDLHNRQHEPQGVLDAASAAILEIADRRATQSIAHARPVVQKTVSMIEQIVIAKGKGGYNGIPSGFDALDKLTTGFKGGEMIVLAARPGVGKTAFALTMAKNMIRERYSEAQGTMVRPGYKVGIFSLEMTNQQLMLRLLAAHANLSMQAIRNGTLSNSDLAALTAVADEVSSLPLYLDESSSLSIAQVRAKARRMKQLFGIEVIIIDYLQLLTSSSEKARDNRQVEVAEVSRGIKSLALELDIPVIVLAQLNRKSEEGTNSEPALHHLRESGSIEQDADVVLMLSRVENKENEWETFQHPNGKFYKKMSLNIAKQRNGPTDKIDLLYLSECTLFESALRTAK
jgi:replicative DNA helicase